MAMEGNSNRKRITWGSITGSAAFRRGMLDYQSGLPIDETFRNKEAWHYERGRLYAAACAGRGAAPLPQRIGRHLNRALISDFADKYARKEIL